MKRNQTAFAILGILAIHGNQSGYEVRRTVQTTVGFFWGESYGQIYPTMKRLAAEGLIAEELAASTGKRRRRGYSITASGCEQLRQWLAVPYRNDPPRDEFLMKLFFGHEAAHGVSIAHIRKFQQEHRALLASLLELERLARARNAANPGFPFWMLTLSFGLSQIRCALEWSESALATLQAMESNPLTSTHDSVHAQIATTSPESTRSLNASSTDIEDR